jgi:alkaline phosphatase D
MISMIPSRQHSSHVLPRPRLLPTSTSTSTIKAANHRLVFLFVLLLVACCHLNLGLLRLFPQIVLQTNADEHAQDSHTPPRRHLQATANRPSLPPPFLHGVASGDPTAEAVIIWTRLTLSPTTDTDTDDVKVTWQVFQSDSSYRSSAAVSGTAFTNADKDYTVKVDVTGLQAYTVYYYKFTYCDSSFNCVDSVTGRTQTAPSTTTPIQQLRFATVSCSAYQWGYFHAYDRIRELFDNKNKDIDAVIHLGDYIYEHAAGVYGDVRVHEPPHETVTLSDYRTRYAQYRRDRSLNDLHQTYAWISTWDDHEFANDAWNGGSQTHDPSVQGPWIDRRRAAARAFREWMPFRIANDTGDDTSTSFPIYRTLRYGTLVDLLVLDNRIAGRDEQKDALQGGQAKFLPNYYDPDHDLLGDVQMEWLKDALRTSTAQWKVLVQPIVFSPISFLGLFSHNNDAWDGYQASRAELSNFLVDNKIDNIVFLSGDIHAAIASEIPQEKTADLQTWTDWLLAWPRTWIRGDSYTSIAVEFVVNSVTSITIIEEGNIPLLPKAADVFFRTIGLWANPHGKYIDTLNHGYQIIDFQPHKVQQDIYFTGPPEHEVDNRPPEERYQTSFFSLAGGDNTLQQTQQESERLQR